MIEVSQAFTLKTHNRNGINMEPCLSLAISNVHAQIHKLLKEKKTASSLFFRRDIFKNIYFFVFHNSQNIY